MRGLQCLKALYLAVHRPDLETETSAAKQAVLDQGHLVGVRAHQEVPGGVLVEAPYFDTEGAVRETLAAVQAGASVIYEATLVNDGVSARVDIFAKSPDGDGWQVIEVKSSTSVKPEHLSDVAIQVHVAEGAGFRVDSAEVMHLDNLATAPSLVNLFRRVDVSQEIAPIRAELPKVIESMRAMLGQDEVPRQDIGQHCFSPHECPFIQHCWSHVVSPSIFDFPALGPKVWEFYADGVVSLHDEKFGPFVGTHLHRLTAARSGKRWVDVEGIATAMKDWKWPLIHLDFETIAFAIPRYDGTHPYQQVPFQFSVLVQDAKGGPCRHVEFLHDGESDPRAPLAAALAKVLNQPGNIVAYNKAFEAQCLRDLAKACPEHAVILNQACERLVDPLPIFRSAVYDPAFKSSFSIKSVAPAILGEHASYKTLEVPDGSAAQRAFTESIAPTTTAERKAQLRTAMLEYCKKDTEVMAQLVDWLVAASLNSSRD